MQDLNPGKAEVRAFWLNALVQADVSEVIVVRKYGRSCCARNGHSPQDRGLPGRKDEPSGVKHTQYVLIFLLPKAN